MHSSSSMVWVQGGIGDKHRFVFETEKFLQIQNV